MVVEAQRALSLGGAGSCYLNAQRQRKVVPWILAHQLPLVGRSLSFRLVYGRQATGGGRRREDTEVQALIQAGGAYSTIVFRVSRSVLIFRFKESICSSSSTAGGAEFPLDARCFGLSPAVASDD
ncbi:hypothetical protein EVG20_g10710 [Dentipellis fragilis]|uniref:Uncharacterized protein n=1 Tax=Dentipellis fragilis TaxID=205917 RepID=A0A4Y9XQN6_9AGAM|nr:hypothetical protein EVG20_g10710 [Dentipellis fragilis]